MRSLFTIVIISTLATTLAGCSAFTPPVQTRTVVKGEDNKKDGVYAVDFDANRRAAYVVVAGGKSTFVAEPPPDSVLTQAIKGGAEVTISETSPSGKLNSDISLTPNIINRALSVSILRDGSYRLAEAYANGAIAAQEYFSLYSKLNETVLTIGLKEAEAKLVEQLASTIKKREQLIEGLSTSMLLSMESNPENPEAKVNQNLLESYNNTISVLQTALQQIDN